MTTHLERRLWPCPFRVGLTFSDPTDPLQGIHAEYVRADLCEDPETIEMAARALHDHEPWVYGQDVDGADITKPWESAPPAVQQDYRATARVALKVMGERA